MNVFKNISFNGRASRKEYWIFILLLAFITILITIADKTLGSYIEGPAFDLITLLFYILILIHISAFSVRRLHDTDRTGWWALIQLVPFIGAVVWLVFAVLPGHKGKNRFGPDPKQISQTRPIK